ncbi:MAG: exopolysaccharide biosynthesis protein [Alphaproteobacteria bacterium]|nr:exopolysaccharide biosynthesis protein [Alphaproteobacteria bacterium]
MGEVYNLGSLLNLMCRETSGDEVSVEDLLNVVGRRAYGPVLLLLGFIAVSPLSIVPGLNWITALITLLFAVQIIIGWKRPWIPARILRIRFPRKYLVQGVEASQPYVHRIDAFLKPRLTMLTEPPFVQLVAMVCAAAALVTFPLGLIPFGPTLPGLTILFMGLGLASRDGFMLLLAGCALVGAVLVTMRAWSALPFT